MKNKIKLMTDFLNTPEIQTITGLQTLNIPDGLKDETQQAILATYLLNVTDAHCTQFEAVDRTNFKLVASVKVFWDNFEVIFKQEGQESDSEPFADKEMDMTAYLSGEATQPVEKTQEQLDAEKLIQDVNDANDQAQNGEKPPNESSEKPEPQPEKDQKSDPAKSTETKVVDKGPDISKSPKKRAPKKKSDNLAEALFHLIPAEKQLDLMLANVSPDDFGSLTKDQLTEITRHLMNVNKEV